MHPSVSRTVTPRASWRFAFGSASTARTGVSPWSISERIIRELIVVLPVPPLPDNAMIKGVCAIKSSGTGSFSAGFVPDTLGDLCGSFHDCQSPAPVGKPYTAAGGDKGLCIKKLLRHA